MYGSAHFFLLPYLEQTALYTQANGDSWNVRMTAVKGFSCPSDLSAPPGDVTSANTVHYTDSSYNYTNLGTTSYAINHSTVQFGNHSLTNAMPNGTSNTVLFAERYQICDYQAYGNETVSARRPTRRQ